ncbi:MAG: YaiI/YqxD family protein [Xanthobacteraceae bacterium]
MSKPIAIYVDADACPVKAEIYRVAERHLGKGLELKVFVVTNSPIAVPRHPSIERVVVGAGLDAADDWIAARADAGAIVITADIPLAARCVKAGARTIAPTGRAFTEESIGMTLATRNLMDSLRSAGEITGGPKPFSPRDRSAFLSALDQAIVRLQRAGHG